MGTFSDFFGSFTDYEVGVNDDDVTVEHFGKLGSQSFQQISELDIFYKRPLPEVMTDPCQRSWGGSKKPTTIIHKGKIKSLMTSPFRLFIGVFAKEVFGH